MNEFFIAYQNARVPSHKDLRIFTEPGFKGHRGEEFYVYFVEKNKIIINTIKKNLNDYTDKQRIPLFYTIKPPSRTTITQYKVIQRRIKAALGKS